MTAWYNEIDPFAAAWLRELIKAGHIAPGEVDERSIIDVRPDDLRGFTQCHFFAGIGVWSHALRRAGWADDRPVWTGSCPCQPFSAAGKGGGFDDERHLWPAWHHLIGECRPGVVLGEQVASKDGLGWLDLVQADLEAAGYASGAVDLCAAGVGAPHIRQRLWFVAKGLADANFGAGEQGRSFGAGRDHRSHAVEGAGFGSSGFAGRMDDDPRLERQRSGYPTESGRLGAVRSVTAAGEPGRVADADITGPATHTGDTGQVGGLPEAQREPEHGAALSGRSGATGGLGHAERIGAGRDAGTGAKAQRGAGLRAERHDAGSSGSIRGVADAADARRDEAGQHECGSPPFPARLAEHGGMVRPAGPVNGIWRDADWLYCRDGKWRPVEPGTFPLAHGAPARVGRLRGYGNAINAEAAVAFIEAYLDIDTLDLDARRVRLMSRMEDDMGVFG